MLSSIRLITAHAALSPSACHRKEREKRARREEEKKKKKGLGIIMIILVHMTSHRRHRVGGWVGEEEKVVSLPLLRLQNSNNRSNKRMNIKGREHHSFVLVLIWLLLPLLMRVIGG